MRTLGRTCSNASSDASHTRVRQKWRELVAASRKAFLDRCERIPGANKAVRLARLERIYLYYESTGNYMAALGVLEQMAREAAGTWN